MDHRKDQPVSAVKLCILFNMRKSYIIWLSKEKLCSMLCFEFVKKLFIEICEKIIVKKKQIGSVTSQKPCTRAKALCLLQ